MEILFGSFLFIALIIGVVLFFVIKAAPAPVSKKIILGSTQKIREEIIEVRQKTYHLVGDVLAFYQQNDDAAIRQRYDNLRANYSAIRTEVEVFRRRYASYERRKVEAGFYELCTNYDAVIMRSITSNENIVADVMSLDVFINRGMQISKEAQTFMYIYPSAEDTAQIDSLRANLQQLETNYAQLRQELSAATFITGEARQTAAGIIGRIDRCTSHFAEMRRYLESNDITAYTARITTVDPSNLFDSASYIELFNDAVNDKSIDTFQAAADQAYYQEM